MVHLEPVGASLLLRELPLGSTSFPRAPPLIIGDEWLKSIFGSSSGGGSAPGWVPCGARPAIVGAPAPSPLPRRGEPLQGPPPASMAEDDVDDVLKRARGRSAVRQEFLQKATDAVSQLGAELAGEDARLEAEGMWLAEKRRTLKMAVSLARHQRDLDNVKAKASLAASRKACSRAIEEAQEADR